MKKIFRNTLNVLNRAEKRRLILLAFSDILISILDLGVLALLLLQINFYLQPQNAPAPSWLAPWFGLGLMANLVMLLLAFIIKNMAGYFIHRAKYLLAYDIASRISENNLLDYLEGNFNDFVKKDSAVHIRKISQQPVEFCHYVVAGLQRMFSETIMIALTLTIILIFNASLFLMLCLVLLPPLLLLSYYTKRKLGNVRTHIRTSGEKALQHLKEALSGYIESNVYNKKDFFTSRYIGRQHTLNRYLAELQSVQVLPSKLLEVFAVTGLLTLIAINELFLGKPVVPLITIGVFFAAAYKIIPGIVKILNAVAQVKTYSFTAVDLAKDKLNNNSAESLKEHIHSLEFRKVSFQFENGHLLRDIDLKIKPGELVGLTGISGKGKTTIFNLLLGFLEQGSGNILVNDHSTSSEERKQLWSNTSYVKQQPFLVHDTILTNITLNGQNFNRQSLNEAVTAAGLDKFINQLPDGLNTLITENGRNLSGGQRQRIALARAFYKNPDLLLLDEPFSELDETSEQQMLQHLVSMSRQGKLVLLVTHNKKSLSFCTKTISMDAT
ncbi:MAG TPA: ABC transporter ATP-binding protein [Chitinophagaceae bacterium]